jgi:hypothetical protein
MEAQKKGGIPKAFPRIMPKPRADGITILSCHEIDAGKECTIQRHDGTIEVCRAYANPTTNKQRAETARTWRLLKRKVRVITEPRLSGKPLKQHLKQRRERLLNRVKRQEERERKTPAK